MNGVLDTIVRTQQVSDGAATLPLRHPVFSELPVAVDRQEGEFLQAIVRDVRPRTSIEIGCAYGVSSLFICEALAELPGERRHIVIDPFQSEQWRGIGIRNLNDAGFASLVDFREQPSELALPALLAADTTIEFAFVDGWHTFDQVMVEFFYLNRMLAPGGVIAFDDADRRSVNRAVRHAIAYPCYRVYGASAPQPERVSGAGHARRLLGRSRTLRQLIRADVLDRDWDLRILGSCVAIQKTADDRRSSGWDRVF